MFRRKAKQAANPTEDALRILSRLSAVLKDVDLLTVPVMPILSDLGKNVDKIYDVIRSITAIIDGGDGGYMKQMNAYFSHLCTLLIVQIQNCRAVAEQLLTILIKGSRTSKDFSLYVWSQMEIYHRQLHDQEVPLQVGLQTLGLNLSLYKPGESTEDIEAQIQTLQTLLESASEVNGPILSSARQVLLSAISKVSHRQTRKANPAMAMAERQKRPSLPQIPSDPHPDSSPLPNMHMARGSGVSERIIPRQSDTGRPLDGPPADETENELEFQITENLLLRFEKLCLNGDPSQARKVLQKATENGLHLNEKQKQDLGLPGAKGKLCASFLSNMKLLCEQGELDQAERRLREALEELDRKSLTDGVLDLIDAHLKEIRISHFIDLTDMEMSLKKATRLVQEFQIEQRRTNMIMAQLTVAQCMIDRQQISEAQIIVKSHLTDQSAGTEDVLVTATANYLMALIYVSEANFNDARDSCKRSINVRRKILGKEHSDCAQALELMARIHRLEGNEIIAQAYEDLLPRHWLSRKLSKEPRNHVRETSEFEAAGPGRIINPFYVGWISCNAVSSACALLATSDYGRIQMWKSFTGKPYGQPFGLKQTMISHSMEMREDAMAFSRNDSLLVHAYMRHANVWSLSSDGAVLLHRINHEMINDEAYLTAVAFTSTNSVITSCRFDNCVRIWNTETGHLERSLQTGQRLLWDTVSFPSLEMIATCPEKEVLVWAFPAKATPRTIMRQSLLPRSGRHKPCLLASSQSKSRLACVSWKETSSDSAREHSISFYALPSCTESNRIDFVLDTTKDGAVQRLVLSSDGLFVALSTTTDRVMVWNCQDERIWLDVKTKERTSSGLVFSPDAKLLLSTTITGVMELWKIDTR